MNNIKVQPYSDVYKNQVTQLILNICEEFSIPISIQDQPDLDQIPQFYQKESGNFWIALDGNKIVGTIALIDIGNCQAALRKMFVKRDYRGKEKEVAKFLLNTLINWCNQKVSREIYLGTRAIFLAAHRFYEKNGFDEISKDTLPISFPVMQADSKFYIWRSRTNNGFYNTAFE